MRRDLTGEQVGDAEGTYEEARMSGFLILPGWLIEDARKTPRREWGVRVEGDCISEVAPNDDLRARFPDAEIWEAADQVLSPGFVNAHSHLYGVLSHGIPLTSPPSDFWSFLRNFWWPDVEDRIDHDMIRSASDLRCADMLASGVTTFYDCTEAPRALPGVLEVQADVVRKHGIRAVLSFEATERVSKENGQLGLRENADFIRACERNPGLVSGLMCFHTTFTCSADFIKQAVELALDLGVPVHFHCAEGTYEPRYTMSHFAKRTLHYYDSLGVTGPHLIASQCVQIDESEIALIADKGIRVTHMPLSNCEVGGGIAPIPQLSDAGVTIGLGSDGYIDDFFEVMRGAFLIHKAHHTDPQVMPADLVWYLATEGGAHALGLEKIGRVEPGWKADLVLIDADLPTPLTNQNLYEQVMLNCSSSNVKAVFVDGQPRVRDGEVLDCDRAALRARTRQASRKLWMRESTSGIKGDWSEDEDD